MTLVDRGQAGSTPEEVEVCGPWEVGWAWGWVGAVVPDREVLDCGIPMLKQRMRPGHARCRKLVRSFVEASADGLPRQEPAVLLRLREGLFHL